VDHPEARKGTHPPGPSAASRQARSGVGLGPGKRIRPGRAGRGGPPKPKFPGARNRGAGGEAMPEALAGIISGGWWRGGFGPGGGPNGPACPRGTGNCRTHTGTCYGGIGASLPRPAQPDLPNTTGKKRRGTGIKGRRDQAPEGTAGQGGGGQQGGATGARRGRRTRPATTGAKGSTRGAGRGPRGAGQDPATPPPRGARGAHAWGVPAISGLGAQGGSPQATQPPDRGRRGTGSPCRYSVGPREEGGKPPNGRGALGR